jgi:hypothetical protein
LVPTANVLVTLTVDILLETITLESVVLPVTDNVLAIEAEPLTNKSSNPIASSVMLPDTVKLPEIVASPTTLSVLPATRFVFA